MLFTVLGQKHKFGSKLFPVSSKSKMELFAYENTVEFNRDDSKTIELARQIDKHNYPMGRCYLNADIITQIAKALGFNAQYYSGWLMFNGLMPLHHAWVIINNTSVIDVGINTEEFRVMQEADRNELDWKEKLAVRIADIRKSGYPASEYCSFGRLKEWYILVGSPDEPENARRIFNELKRNYPNHPSYIHRGGNMNGASELQKMIFKQL